MNNTKTLKLNKDFRRLYYRGKSCVAKTVVVYAMKNRTSTNRVGITCGKAIGKAVVRNRVKRLMRESYRLMEQNLPVGYDFVIVARRSAVGKKLCVVSKDMEYAMKKLFN